MEKKDAAGCVTSVIFRDIRFPTRLEKDGSDSIVSIVIVVFSFQCECTSKCSQNSRSFYYVE